MTYEYFKILEYINSFIKFSDAKAGALLTFNMALTVAVLNKFENFKILNQLHCSKHLFIITTSAYFVFILLSISRTLLSIHPSLKAEGHTSNIFFAHIAGKQINIFKDEITNQVNGYDYVNDITYQIKINSDICWRKYRHISWAIKFTAIAMLSLSISILIITTL